MGVLDKYECDGQMTISEYYNKQKELEGKYPIPRLSPQLRRDEGWTDDWHYLEVEKPTENDVYYTIEVYKDLYMYKYNAYTSGMWFWWDSWFKRWNRFNDDDVILAWVQIPSIYRQKDTSLHEMLGLRGII